MSTCYFSVGKANKLSDLHRSIKFVEHHESDDSMHEVSRDEIGVRESICCTDGNSYLWVEVNDGLITGFTRYGRNTPFLLDYLHDMASEHEVWYNEDTDEMELI